MECIAPYDVLSMKFSEELRWQGHYEYFLSSKGHNSHKNFLPIWCYIYITSFMIIGSVVSEELQWQDFGTDGRTDGQRGDCTPRPAVAFGDAGKKKTTKKQNSGFSCIFIYFAIKIWMKTVLSAQMSRRNNEMKMYHCLESFALLTSMS